MCLIFPFPWHDSNKPWLWAELSCCKPVFTALSIWWLNTSKDGIWATFKYRSTTSLLLPAPSLSYFVGGVLSIQPTFFFNGLKNFVTVDIFMMSVNKKDLLFKLVVWTFCTIQWSSSISAKVMVMSRSSRSGMSHNKTPLMRYDSQTLGNMYFNTIKTPLIE